MRALLYATGLSLLLAANVAAQFGAAPPQADELNVEQAGVAEPADAAAPAPNPMFALIDADGDGVISKAELRKAVAALRKLDADGDGNITLAEAVPQHMMPMLQGADSNGDGNIDKDELAAAMQNNQFRGGPGGFPAGARGAGADPRTGQLLRRYDLNNDGRLSPVELPSQMKRMLQPTDDLNGDGQLDPAELQAVMARMGGAARAHAAGAQPNARPFQDPNRRARPAGDQDQN